MANPSIKSRNFLLIIGFGLALVFGIIYVQNVQISKEVKSARVAEFMIATFAARDIFKGQIVTRDMLVTKKTDCKYIPGDGLWNPQIAIGKVCKYDLKKGDLMCTHHFGLYKFDKELLRKWPPLPRI